MAIIKKSVLVSYSASQMFALVNDVAAYPQFLPWCSEVTVLEHSATRLVATLAMHFHGIHHRFTTENTHTEPSAIVIKLVSGPFKHLDGTWRFTALSEKAAKVELDMHYEFSNKILEHLIGPVFNKITNNLVDAFCKRAQSIYAK